MSPPLVCLRQQYAVEVQRRNLAMSMAHEDNVDSGHFLRNRDRLVLVWYLSRTRFTGAQVLAESHVHCDNHDVNFLCRSQRCDPLARLNHRVTKFEAGIVRWIVPVRNSWRSEPKNPDPDAGNFFNNVWLVMSALRSLFVSVSGKPRKLRLAPRFLQHLESEVVLVVSDRHCVVVE